MRETYNGYVASDNPLRQAFHDCSFANARLSLHTKLVSNTTSFKVRMPALTHKTDLVHPELYNKRSEMHVRNHIETSTVPMKEWPHLSDQNRVVLGACTATGRMSDHNETVHVCSYTSIHALHSHA